ncbi:MAG: hypothetical protein LBJ67_16085 [Planctomycetaceae bacterium]|nr:hypothetical protein [Planctomycetaceae bacterium]
MKNNKIWSYVVIGFLLLLLPITYLLRKEFQKPFPPEKTWFHIERDAIEPNIEFIQSQAKTTLVPVPEDIAWLSEVVVSSDQKRIAVAGGWFPHQKIYTASFPPKSPKDYSLLIDMPDAHDILAMEWSPFDDKTLAFFAVTEQTDDLVASNSFVSDKSQQVVDNSDDGFLVKTLFIADRESKKINTIYTFPETHTEQFVQSNCDKGRFSFCWYSSNEILCLKRDQIFSIDLLSKKIEKLKEFSNERVLSVNF